jgi:hypothetical protein
MKQIRTLDHAIATGDFGAPTLHRDPPIFMEFKDHPDLKQVARYTIEDAVGKRHPLTPAEKSLLHKFQFEVYKPSMGDYVYFDDFATIEEALPHEMDTKFVRSNFENNLAFPLLNYEEQSFLSAGDRATLKLHRDQFLDRVYDLLKKVEADPRYAFLKGHDDFLYLADYLKASTHPSRPNFDLVTPKLAKEQRALLEELTKKLRKLSMQFVQDTRVDKMVEKSLPGAFRGMEKPGALKSHPTAMPTPAECGIHFSHL